MTNHYGARDAIAAKLDLPLPIYLKRCRERGMGYQRIANDLLERTGVPISKWTVGRWLAQYKSGARHV